MKLIVFLVAALMGGCVSSPQTSSLFQNGIPIDYIPGYIPENAIKTGKSKNELMSKEIQKSSEERKTGKISRSESIERQAASIKKYFPNDYNMNKLGATVLYHAKRLETGEILQHEYDYQVNLANIEFNESIQKRLAAVEEYTAYIHQQQQIDQAKQNVLFFNALGQGFKRSAQQRRPQINCRSYSLGATVYTDCN